MQGTTSTETTPALLYAGRRLLHGSAHIEPGTPVPDAGTWPAWRELLHVGDLVPAPGATVEETEVAVLAANARGQAATQAQAPAAPAATTDTATTPAPTPHTHDHAHRKGRRSDR